MSIILSFYLSIQDIWESSKLWSSTDGSECPSPNSRPHWNSTPIFMISGSELEKQNMWVDWEADILLIVS